MSDRGEFSDPKPEAEVAAEAEVAPEVDPNAGKTVIVSGSPEHEALLKAYPNATSYPADVVIVPAPEPEPEVVAEEGPVQEQEGVVEQRNVDDEEV